MEKGERVGMEGGKGVLEGEEGKVEIEGGGGEVMEVVIGRGVMLRRRRVVG
ncbi:hypothetical protein [Dermacoccus nishinomiyaensis]|uniref:hypothetical protein n=1 Tax=Dermacoccus nishinomiyaensis TaxID=1274 RepID=UPI0016435A39|nr:hypothetical protein [Dermacoccus nishinomiyaensis]